MTRRSPVPKLRDAWYNRGVVQRRCKHYDEAIRNQTEALNLRPEAPIDPLLERATAYAASARFHESFKDLDIILVLQPDHLDALITRGKVLGDLNDLWRSEQDFDRAIQIAPKEPAAYRGRGLTRFRTENWAGAIADWRTYLEQVPDAPDRGSILNDISVAYLKLNMPNEAIQALDAALAIRPDASWQTNRGNVLLQQGELRQAIASFDRALERDRTHTRAWALRGQAHLRQGHHAEAVSDLDQALALEPGVYETLLFRGLAHFHQGSPEKARKDWEVLVTDRPEHVRGRFARGGLHLLDKQYPQAAMELARVLDDNILRPFALALLAQTHLESGGPSVPVAVRYAKDLVQALPKDALAHLTAARILAQATKTAGNDQATAWRGEALEYLHSAINLSDEVKGWVEGDPIFDALRKDPKFPR
jgi:tetratricopeptide (TPR) repeat protein